MNLFDIILVPLGHLVRICNLIVPNYAVSLLLVALLLKLLLIPFGVKQQKNSIKQASLQPKERAIRKKYAGRTDRTTQLKMNEEIQQLYREENFNMFGGCLPMLLQFPILIALYTVIRTPLQYIMQMGAEVIDGLELRFLELFNGGLLNAPQGLMSELQKAVDKAAEAGTTLTGSDLALSQIDMISTIRANPAQFSEFFESNGVEMSKLPDFTLFGLDLGQTPSFDPPEPVYWLLLLIPVLTFVLLFFSMKLTRKFTYQAPQNEDAARSMKIMDFTMPLLSVWITFGVPAVIGLYWIYQNVLGTLQQFILSKVLPVPQFTEEEFKEAERKYFGTQSKKEKKKVRSLHHIDDDDYDANGKLKAAPAKKEPAIESPVGKAPLKDEGRGGNKLTEKTDRGEKKKVRSLHHIDDEDYDENGNYKPALKKAEEPSPAPGAGEGQDDKTKE